MWMVLTPARRLRRRHAVARPRRRRACRRGSTGRPGSRPLAHARLADVVVEDHAERDRSRYGLPSLPVVRVLARRSCGRRAPAPRACTDRVPTGCVVQRAGGDAPSGWRSARGCRRAVSGKAIHGNFSAISTVSGSTTVTDSMLAALAERPRPGVRVHVPLEVDLHRLGVERRAVLEHHPVVQGDRVRLVVVGLDRLGQVRLGHAVGRRACISGSYSAKPMWASVTPPTNVVGSSPKASKIVADGDLATGGRLGPPASVVGAAVSSAGRRCSSGSVAARGVGAAPRCRCRGRRRGVGRGHLGGVGGGVRVIVVVVTARRGEQRAAAIPAAASRGALARAEGSSSGGLLRWCRGHVGRWLVMVVSGKWQATKWSGAGGSRASAPRLAQTLGGAGQRVRKRHPLGGLDRRRDLVACHAALGGAHARGRAPGPTRAGRRCTGAPAARTARRPAPTSHSLPRYMHGDAVADVLARRRGRGR